MLKLLFWTGIFEILAKTLDFSDVFPFSEQVMSLIHVYV